MPEAPQGCETHDFRANTRREERYGGYTPGKNSSDLRTPRGLRTPAPSRPQSSQAPASQNSGQPASRRD